MMHPKVEALMQLAEKRGLSKVRLARIVGVSHMSVYRWCRGVLPIPACMRLIDDVLREAE